MCLIVFGFKTHPEYNLIFASNRDEFYERPSLTARLWDEELQIIGGRDLKKGGTWMGIRKTGRFSAVTNFRDPGNYKKNAISRGCLITESLKNSTSPENYLNYIKNRSDLYNGFNLVTGTGKKLYHFSNYEESINRIKPGLHGLSNALLDTPWPKVKRAKNKFKKLLTKDKITDNDLFDILTDRKTFTKEELPETGISPEMEQALSSIFIQTDTYGTRSSNLLYIKKNGNIRFVERTYKPGSMNVENEVVHTIIFK